MNKYHLSESDNRQSLSWIEKVGHQLVKTVSVTIGPYTDTHFTSLSDFLIHVGKNDRKNFEYEYLSKFHMTGGNPVEKQIIYDKLREEFKDDPTILRILTPDFYFTRNYLDPIPSKNIYDNDDVDEYLIG